MKNILIIKCGDTMPQIKMQFGDFEDWIIKISGLTEENFKIFNLPCGDQLRRPDEFSAAIITDSHLSTNQRIPWFKQLKDWIVMARYSNFPVLGIGFGHHIMAEALGGKVSRNNSGLFLGTSFIHVSPAGKTSPLFRNAGSSFDSYLNYTRHVSYLPDGIDILASNISGTIMAFRINKLTGIQFHPEIPEKAFKMYVKSSSLPLSSHLGVKLISEYKNRSVISNFLDSSLIF
jgi:GMP synthase (glutamine-hydrolysing)